MFSRNRYCKIFSSLKDSKKFYGRPRIHAELKEKGDSYSRHRVARLRKESEIVFKNKKKFRVTTNSNYFYLIAENLLQRQFDVSRTGEC
jgi:putative transposase